MIYGLMAEFDNPSALVAAAREAHAAGYRRMDAYTPFPVEELNEALGLGHTGVAALVLIGGLISSTLLSRLVTPVMYKLLPPKVQVIGEQPGDIPLH